jgi:hypothetical protein
MKQPSTCENVTNTDCNPVELFLVHTSSELSASFVEIDMVIILVSTYFIKRHKVSTTFFTGIFRRSTKNEDSYSVRTTCTNDVAHATKYERSINNKNTNSHIKTRKRIKSPPKYIRRRDSNFPSP